MFVLEGVVGDELSSEFYERKVYEAGSLDENLTVFLGFVAARGVDSVVWDNFFVLDKILCSF